MKNRTLAALQEQGNLLGLASAAALSVALFNPFPLFGAFLLEAVYLLLVPNTKWYQQRLARRQNAGFQASRDAIKAQSLPLLRPAMRARFEKLEEMRGQIEGQAAGKELWLDEILDKLDFLLENFLQFAVKQEQFLQYLEQTREEIEREIAGKSKIVPMDWQTRRANELRQMGVQGKSHDTRREFAKDWAPQSVSLIQEAYQKELAQLQADLDQETDDATQAVLQKRLEVLQRRRDFLGKIGKILANLAHQIELLEDTFGLINDELMARPPEQMVSEIEDVVSQTNAMTQVLEEMAPYERMLKSVERGQATFG